MPDLANFNLVVHDAALFVRRAKVGVRLKVYTDGTTLLALRPDGMVLREFEILEVVTEGMAWDVRQGSNRVRVVAQKGCGCGGMRKYKPDPGYSNTLNPTQLYAPLQ